MKRQKKEEHSALGASIIEGLQQARDHFIHNDSSKVRVTKIVKLELLAIRPYSSKEVKNLRIKHGMTQEYFAEVMGVTVDTVRKWEQKSGIKSGPAIRILQQIEASGIPEELLA